MLMNHTHLPDAPNYTAPDGAQIRLLLENNQGGVAHCILEKDTVSITTRHKTVSEFWYVLSGAGEIWLKRAGQEQVIDLIPGVCLEIPVGTIFQYRANAKQDLKFLCMTMPPWSGPDEAEMISESHY